MPQQLQGGNPNTNDYDYATGSGFDDFLSRSIDEVSWQSQGLGTTYTTLTTLPIGLSPTTATATNYDATQVSGSQSGASVLGGSGTGNSAQAGGLSINAVDGNIILSDGTNNRLVLGYDQGAF